MPSGSQANFSVDVTISGEINGIKIRSKTNGPFMKPGI